jgi:hypothetical protein
MPVEREPFPVRRTQNKVFDNNYYRLAGIFSASLELKYNCRTD